MLLDVNPKAASSDAICRLAEILTGRTPVVDESRSVLPFLSFLKGRKSA
jgi:hypothetical protein